LENLKLKKIIEENFQKEQKAKDDLKNELKSKIQELEISRPQEI
jgi:hypothetical protein